MCETFFNYFYFAMNYAILKSKNACFLFNENTKFNKNKMGSKMVILHTVLEGWTLHLFSSYKDCKSKVKLWWVWAQKINKKGIFVTFVLSERNLLSCVLSQCIANWINFKSIYTFTYQKTTLLLLVFKIDKPLKSILNDISCLVWCKNIGTLLIYFHQSLTLLHQEMPFYLS